MNKKLIKDYLLAESIQEIDRIKNIVTIMQNTENEL